MTQISRLKDPRAQCNQSKNDISLSNFRALAEEKILKSPLKEKKINNIRFI